MDPRIAALSVHLFTASGAVFAMLSMLAAANHQWSLMFLWLVVAFAVDGIDGPLARKFDVKNYAPRFDGVLLDLIIDYLTYVFIPAFALFQSGLLPGWTGWVTIIIITFASAMYFCDGNMKTKDNSFRERNLILQASEIERLVRKVALDRRAAVESRSAVAQI